MDCIGINQTIRGGETGEVKVVMIYVTPSSCQTHAGWLIKPAKIEFIYFSADQHQQ